MAIEDFQGLFFTKVVSRHKRIIHSDYAVLRKPIDLFVPLGTDDNSPLIYRRGWLRHKPLSPGGTTEYDTRNNSVVPPGLKDLIYTIPVAEANGLLSIAPIGADSINCFVLLHTVNNSNQ